MSTALLETGTACVASANIHSLRYLMLRAHQDSLKSNDICTVLKESIAT
jgi:hypothetical protein